MRHVSIYFFFLCVFFLAATLNPVYAQGLIPDTQYLKSDTLTYTSNDLSISYPSTTNFRSQVQAGRTVTSYQFFTGPPINTPRYDDTEPILDTAPNSAQLYLQEGTGTIIDLEKLTNPISYTAYPDRIERTQQYKTYKIESTLSLVKNTDALALKIKITNTGTTSVNNLTVYVLNAPAAALHKDGWSWSFPNINVNTNMELKNGVFISTDDGKGYSATTTNPFPDNYASFAKRNDFLANGGTFNKVLTTPNKYTVFSYKPTFTPGSSWILAYSEALDTTAEAATANALTTVGNIESSITTETANWNQVLIDAFTQGNPTFSGYLPTLKTNDKQIERMYYMGIATLLSHRRTDPDSQYGTVYVTLTPEFGVTTIFFWDTAMASKILAQLDPQVLKKLVEKGYGVDINKTNILNYLPESLVLYDHAYAANRYSLFQMANNYVAYSGDYAWLDTSIGGKKVIDYMASSANYGITQADTDGLFDYGQNKDLLEIVPTYEHKVASFNAANVWMQEQLAEIYDRRGEPAKATTARANATKAADAVKTLYLNGKGYWNVKTLTGALIPVRHVYDFAIVLGSMGKYLSQTQKDEMVHFWQTELRTPTWMRALSELDTAPVVETRTDHSDLGAYAGWPFSSILALYKNGYTTEADAWIGSNNRTGLSKVVGQGILGQAYWSGEGRGTLTINGVAQKSGIERAMYLSIVRPQRGVLMSNGEISGTSISTVVTDGLFGLDATTNKGLIATPHFGQLSPESTLYNYAYQGNNYTITKDGWTLPTCNILWWKRFNNCSYIDIDAEFNKWKCTYLKLGNCTTDSVVRDINNDGKVSLYDLQYFIDK